jgi:ComF family protein
MNEHIAIWVNSLVNFLLEGEYIGALPMQASEQALPQIAGWRERLRRLGGAMLDSLLPPRCLACGELVDAQGRLCGECWGDIAFLYGRQCRSCGVPMPNVSAEAPICGRCLDEPPAFERARSALRYDGVARRLVLRFKHGDRIDGVATFASWMAKAGSDLVNAADLIVPVPLHRWRLVQRSYNQSALLARAIGKVAQKPVLVEGLVKLRATASQQRLDAAERRRNVRAKDFALSPSGRLLVPDRRVLLIDDVLTTGSTASACARCLLAGGASAVDLVTLARVVRDPYAPISLSP